MGYRDTAGICPAAGCAGNSFSHRIAWVALAVQAAWAPWNVLCLPSNPESWMETSIGYLGKVTWLRAVCGNSCFIESFPAVECGWDQIVWELFALCSCQSLAVTHRPHAALGSWGEQDAHEAAPCENKPILSPRE